MSLLFWTAAGLMTATVLAYGLFVISLAALLPRRPPTTPAAPLPATLLITARNEEGCIADKLANALAQNVAPHRLSVVVASDGSTDRTAAIARSMADPRVRVIETADHAGKIAAMQQALATIRDPVVIFSDANSLFVPGALAALLEHFGDPQVGGVCGALGIARRRSGWLGLAEDLYWRYDNAIKRAEHRLGGAVSAQGSLYAMRRELVGAVPPSVADDFFISTGAVTAGRRLAFEPRAVTIEAVSADARGEFGRRVRSTERGWRALLMRRGLLNPARHGAYALQLLFHKLLRRLVPWMLLALFAASLGLAGEHPFYATALAVQAAIYGLALAVAVFPPLRRIPGSSLVFFAVGSQLAMALGLVRVALGRHSSRWTPVRGAAAPAEHS